MIKVLIIEARFYPELADMLLEGAEAFLKENTITYEKVSVPGAFEIPAAIAFAADSKKYDGYIALGCVIRGETTHYDYVCIENARGLNHLAIERKLAIGYGVLTVENETQAIERAHPAKGDKGRAAAEACLTMIQLKKKFAG